MDKNGQPITDDAELAKVLEGMQDATAAAAAAPASGLSFEETTPPAAGPAAAASAPPQTPADPAALPPAAPSTQADYTNAVLTPAAQPTTADPALESIKKDALEQLRPLVDKLALEPDEKFDTLLLIIRSTDDKSLVTQAYDAAKTITDETKRANALLDIIKEIDYFSHPGSPQPQ